MLGGNKQRDILVMRPAIASDIKNEYAKFLVQLCCTLVSKVATGADNVYLHVYILLSISNRGSLSSALCYRVAAKQQKGSPK